ncbi:hypothetical protein CCR85_07885 [Rhodothalassium salexigens]|nr:hypothetical protein [Rhodothalassium salexigens]MBK5920675.1 hypothetical protein [Rhodothalassium salexigens]
MPGVDAWVGRRRRAGFLVGKAPANRKATRAVRPWPRRRWSPGGRVACPYAVRAVVAAGG